MSVRSKSILVTGGAGFIGSHLVDRLLADGPARVTVVDNFFLGSMDNLTDARRARPDLDVIRLDAADLAAMQDVVVAHEVETVFDLAVIPLPTSLTYPAWTVQTNVGIATAFCEIARRGLVERVVHVSSSEAYGSARYIPMDEGHPHDAITPYAASKSAADHIIESYVQTFNIDATVIRPFNNIGPRQNPGSYAGIVPIIVRRVLDGAPIEIYGDGEQTRDFIFVKDTADLIAQIHDSAACRGQVLNVATGVETSVNELVRRILAIMGASDHPVFHSEQRAGDVRRHLADVSKLQGILGHEAPTLSDDALAQTIDWYTSVLA
ncbi:NAD-dependent epimerase/dehydratase family protein [Microbacterium sp. zg.B48]|uniref:dTDP-glucose 4,6-dehydratase n=1 Tax=unclassified Microbacterium TaxID=2609290 RepID=UPI00214C2591|nr:MULTISPECIES: NAD-dependent epimerase/dehydratase family protein [unclassified Microbacterium]MCR2765138.1 NAD-dependent epimerase/dehydratase family protein [Microbacterium sp. zg.B48]MCR2810261.1 NAD-dependent epimerase/dehydratase family protein [Microbacterium sp. zg.B185]WIM19910.1 NAD-dependent epimerase/dehydratase family protein [Microbacterium sp. zg-B185]